MARPLQGKKRKVHKTVRICPDRFKRIIKKYGSLTVFFNKMCEKDKDVK